MIPRDHWGTGVSSVSLDLPDGEKAVRILSNAAMYCQGLWFVHSAKDDPEEVALAAWYLEGEFALTRQLRRVA